MNGKQRIVVAIRILLALVFITYGTFKLAGFQFGLGHSLTETRLCDTSPYIVAWYFFGLSRLYHYAIGTTQILTGLLLLIPRTAPIGALCFFVIIVNIVLINFGYNIATDVKIFSSVLFALDCFLIFHDRRRYQLLLLPQESLDKLLSSTKAG